MKNSISSIKKQFNSELRINESLSSYGLKKKLQVEFDPYEKLRENLIVSLTKEYVKGRSILDIGCGLGTLLVRYNKEGFKPEGFDLAEKAIDIAKGLLIKNNLDPKAAYVSNLFKLDEKKKFSGIIANGVIWYYKNKKPFLDKVSDLLEKDGISIIVHRNDLFNIYALNAGTKFFFEQHFYQKQFSEKSLSSINPWKDLKSFTTTKVNKHSSSALSKPYDNPFDIKEIYRKSGLEVIDVAYTYIHPLPPKVLSQTKLEPSDYKKAQKLFGRSWLGMFTGSQFVVIAKKI